MLSFRLALLLLASAFPQGAGAVRSAPRAQASDLRCEVALSYTKDVLAEYGGKRLVFGAGEPDLFDLAQSGWWVPDSDRPTPATPPPPGLEDRLHDEGNTSAVEHCRSVRKLLQSRGLSFGTRAARTVRAENRRRNYRAAIVHVSLPVVSEDGRQAILAFSHSGAGASLDFLQRQADGRWRVVATRPLGVY